MSRLVLLLVAALAGCDTSGSGGPSVVFVGSQGTDGVGLVTRYSPATGAARATPADGTVQHVETRGGRLYTFLDGAEGGRLQIMDLEADGPVREIAVASPRDWAVVAGTAYVSNGDAGTVTPVFLATGQTGVPIPVGVNPEGVAAVGRRVHVALAGANAVAVVSAENDVRVQTISLGCERPRAALADGDGEVWVVCTGRTVHDGVTGSVRQTDGEVVVLDGSSGEVVARIALDAPAGTAALGQGAALARQRGELWVVAGQTLLRFDTDANALDATVAVGGDALVSALAYDDGADRLVLGRLDAAAPLSAAGFVTVHDRTGAEVARFEAGVAPASIALQDE